MSTERVKTFACAVLVALVTAGLGVATDSAAQAPVPEDLSRALELYQGTEVAAALAEAAAGAVSYGADPRLLAEMVRRAEQTRVSTHELLDAVQRVQEMAGRGLPVSPVVSRYLQGMAKGVPFARVQSVVADLEVRLDEAARAVDESLASSGRVADRSRLDAIDHAAYALAVGVPRGLLDRSLRLVIDGSEPLESLGAPVLTLGVLVAAGVAPEKSLEVVNTAWEHGYRGVELQRLGESMSRLAGPDGTAPPSEVVDKVLAMIGNETDRDQFFRGLDELVGRGDTYRDADLGPGDNPDRGTRIRSRIQDPSDLPIKDRPEEGGGKRTDD